MRSWTHSSRSATSYNAGSSHNSIVAMYAAAARGGVLSSPNVKHRAKHDKW